MTDRNQKIYLILLWALTIAILVLIAVQGLSGNWVTIFFVLPGGTQITTDFLALMGRLAQFHIAVGFTLAVLAVLIAVFAFLRRSSLPVRIFSIAGLLLIGSAAVGGILFVNSMLKDNWPLGQMMDSFVGTFAAYALMLFFMGRTRFQP